MAAVTSEQCLSSHDPNTTNCDVCGLLALPFPFLHYSGNFFTARCSYITKLVHPDTIAKRLQRLAKVAMLAASDVPDSDGAERRGVSFTFGLLPATAPFLGLHRFSGEHWVGSHPSARACDLSVQPRIEYWQDISKPYNYDLEFRLSPFPRHDLHAGWSLVPPDNLAKVLPSP